MTKEQRETLERLRDFSRGMEELLGPPPSKEAWGKSAAALDAALRELDATAAVLAELPGVIRSVLRWAELRGYHEDWQRLCELLPALAGGDAGAGKGKR